MLRFCLTPYQLGPNYITNTVRNKDGRCVQTSLRVTGDIGRCKGDNEAHDRTEESKERVACNRSYGLNSP